jgi:hypothetical protein
MEPRYAVTLDNFRRTSAGGQRLRLGSRWFTDIADVATGTIVDQVFFANSVISVTTTGQITATNSAGSNTLIWSSAIAALLPGAPSGWSSGLTSIDFVPFKTQMIVHNGVDKPVTISSALVVTYLQDPASGSNVNVPIGKYGCVASNYHCIAGIAADPTSVHISSRGTAGTFLGDPPPNDAISIDVGAFAPEGSSEIRGVAGFRSNLIVFFQGQAVVVQLGVYDENDVHTPEFPDTVPMFGLLGHRCIVEIESDLVFAGHDGIASVSRSLLSGLLETDPLVSIIEPEYRRVLGALTDTQLLVNCFMLYDSLEKVLMLVTADGDGFAYSFSQKLKYKAWNRDKDLDFTCGCVSTLGRVFMAAGTRIFQMGNHVYSGESFYADRTLDRDANWNNGTNYVIGDLIYDTLTEESYECISNHLSASSGTFEEDREDQAIGKWELYEGEPITFTMELPWLDGKNPMQSKLNRYVSVATKGDAEFTLSAFVDNLYKDADGTVRYAAALALEFIGNDALGAGFDAGPFGGGRRSNDPRLYRFPVKFKTLKPVFSGMTRRPLEIQNLSFLFSRGSYKR